MPEEDRHLFKRDAGLQEPDREGVPETVGVDTGEAREGSQGSLPVANGRFFVAAARPEIELVVGMSAVIERVKHNLGLGQPDGRARL